MSLRSTLHDSHSVLQFYGTIGQNSGRTAELEKAATFLVKARLSRASLFGGRRTPPQSAAAWREPSRRHTLSVGRRGFM
jgi:hypothetical protein